MENTSYFANSHSFIIGDNGNFATVHGNQILNYFNREPERKTALTIYDQVLLGDIYRTENMGVSTYPRPGDVGERWWREEGKPRADRTICAAQVTGVEGRAFTMISYTGPEAQEAFEKDFQMYATTLTANPFQVYGINTNVPTVLFYDERQPVAKFWAGLGYWGKLYLRSLIEMHFKCYDNKIWLDPKKGELCQGPVGPECYTGSVGYGKWENLPCSAKFLQDSNSLPFLASRKAKSVDREVVDVIAWEWSWGDSKVEVHQPTIFSASTNATVAVSGGLWKSYSSCLGEREVVENGATRLMLKDEGELLSVQIDRLEERRVWMSQALSIFHACGISLNDNLSQFELIIPDLWLEGHLSDSETKCQRRRKKHIYLFVHPLSPSTPTEDCKTSSLHYWSFDPTGQHPLPAEMCEDLGLPIELSFEVYSPYRYCWTNEAYKLMHQYQVARGFNPKTTDFARHLGFPVYQVHRDSDRFEDLSTPKGFWSGWSWAASEGSDIPACGM
ncbi:hypothetical protein V5O48_013632 [Marasmius crinis-equi]|uniref:Uncharacterized protein n=1 Tax=Marasmius crinis-equi TaxID=585013 RepID=A0ABR3EZJ9_9AGAR